MSDLHQGQEASAWVVRWMGLVASECSVLDVACGSGRHARLLAGQGYRVVALDRSADALAGLEQISGIRIVQADIESGVWPLSGQQFDVVIVTNYLHRSLFGVLLESVSESGLLIYETFARGNASFGRPSNPAFLLERGELLDRVRPVLKVLAYEDVQVVAPKPAMVQRICACGPSFQWPTVSR